MLRNRVRNYRLSISLSSHAHFRGKAPLSFSQTADHRPLSAGIEDFTGREESRVFSDFVPLGDGNKENLRFSFCFFGKDGKTGREDVCQKTEREK